MVAAWATVEGIEDEAVSVGAVVAVVAPLLARARTDRALMVELTNRTEAAQVIELAALLFLLRDEGPSGEWC